MLLRVVSCWLVLHICLIKIKQPLNGLFCKHTLAKQCAAEVVLQEPRATVCREGSIHAAAGRFEARGGAPLFSETFFHFKNLKGLIQTSRPCALLWFQGYLLLEPESGISTLTVEGCVQVWETE